MNTRNPKYGPLSIGDSIGACALLFTLIAFVVNPPILLRIVLLLFVSYGLFWFINRSQWTYSWTSWKRQVLASSIAISLLLIGFSQIYQQHTAHPQNEQILSLIASRSHNLSRWLARPWPQRILFIITGILLRAFLGRIIQRLTALRIKQHNIGEKGLLDYKIQTEDSIGRYGKVLNKLTNLHEHAHIMIDQHAAKIKAANGISTRKQIRATNQLAKMLSIFSVKINVRADELEQVGNSLIEGISGWLPLTKSTADQAILSRDLTSPIKSLADKLAISVQIHDAFLETIEGGRGISKDLNLAVVSLSNAVKRIRNITENIKNACMKASALLETYKGETPKLLG